MSGMLDGLRVADLSIVTAGAAATQVLADFGAEVIKIESATRPDLYRAGFTGDKGGPNDLDFPPFRVANRNKRGLSVDLKTPEGHEVARRLIARSDVVVENFRRGAIERLGLGFADLVEIRRDIVLASISSQGATGPNRGYSSFGTTLDSLGGIQSISGYDANTPTWSSGRINYPDQTANSLSPAVIVAAVIAARSDGQARWVDLSQRETVTSLLGEHILATSLGAPDPEPIGNDSVDGSGWVSQCAGDDQWVAITLETDEDRLRLASVVRVDMTASHGADRDADLRRAADAWAEHRDRDAAAADLQNAGVPAVAVVSGHELLNDPALRERGWWQSVELPDGGTEWQRGAVAHFGADAPRDHRRAPHVGEHTLDVLAELDYSDAEIERLLDAGVVSAPVVTAH
jgi:crotonobetainyl-CoA:carnitine CoA-transferase CaiB-like acyl-CoA transferase